MQSRFSSCNTNYSGSPNTNDLNFYSFKHNTSAMDKKTHGLDHIMFFEPRISSNIKEN